MEVVESFPREVREIENCWIPMPDGARLAARIWLPADAQQRPVPAIVEYLPYRKRDGTRWRDEPMHRYFAGHGYAAVRIDLRGAGDSDGVLTDEYTRREHEDGVAAIAWLASQPWCSGAVGMMGKSWGGFNALQIAALRPPELKGIITVCAADDRYSDDAHFMGGCLLNENLTWGMNFLAIAAMPPDPAVVGDRWREMWRERVERIPLFPALWLTHQCRDEYWKHGSVCEDFSRIECPVYAVGGWADGYSNATPRLLAGLTCFRRGLVGPWGHVYPHNGRPGPPIGFLQECLRWWDRWLKGKPTGVEDEPLFRVWMPAAPEAIAAGEDPGRWVAEPQWPPAEQETQGFTLRSGRLVADPSEAEAPQPLTVCSPQTTGLQSGSWCSFGEEFELPGDQRADDGKSLVFDSAACEESFEMLGAASVTLRLASDQPQGHLCVRLNDVSPDGASTRITYGVLNLTHRAGNDKAVAMTPGRFEDLQMMLNDAAYCVQAGHRLRLAISTAYWPLVWPAPAPTTLTLETESSRLTLPVRRPRPEDAALRPFEPPQTAPSPEEIARHEGGWRRVVEHDLVTGATAFVTTIDLLADGQPALTHLPDVDLDLGQGIQERFSVVEGDPLSATAEITHRARHRRGDWDVAVEADLKFHATATTYELESTLRGLENEREAARREWRVSIPRVDAFVAAEALAPPLAGASA